MDGLGYFGKVWISLVRLGWSELVLGRVSVGLGWSGDGLDGFGILWDSLVRFGWVLHGMEWVWYG